MRLFYSKRGFTLVELMIVVVIMAILVAVAVPIYSAVTTKAKAKTCIGNQREIVSSVGNYLMLHGKKDSAVYTLTTTSGADNGEWAFSGGTDYGADTIKSLFQTNPYCPVADNVITVTIVEPENSAGESGFATCKTECDGPGHVFTTNDEE